MKKKSEKEKRWEAYREIVASTAFGKSIERDRLSNNHGRAPQLWEGPPVLSCQIAASVVLLAMGVFVALGAAGAMSGGVFLSLLFASPFVVIGAAIGYRIWRRRRAMRCRSSVSDEEFLECLWDRDDAKRFDSVVAVAVRRRVARAYGLSADLVASDDNGKSLRALSARTDPLLGEIVLDLTLRTDFPPEVDEHLERLRAEYPRPAASAGEVVDRLSGLLPTGYHVTMRHHYDYSESEV